MLSNEYLMEKVMEKVTSQVVNSIKDTLTRAVEQELTGSLTKALVESEFYRKLSDDMRGGLQSIYKEISAATRPDGQAAQGPMEQKSADKLFSEASEQLDEILTTTEEATVEIMDVVEKHMELQAKSAELLGGLRKTRKSNPAIAELTDINAELGDNLIKIMTSLSFQDLTGQRIKKIIKALKNIETTVFELYVATGLSIKAREQSPDKDFAEIEQEAKKKASELKGPTLNANQNEVDDLLSQLGL